jgi:hypothetical protein
MLILSLVELKQMLHRWAAGFGQNRGDVPGARLPLLVNKQTISRTRNEVKVHRPMFHPDRNPLCKASGTTAVKAGTLLSWVLLVPGLVAGLMAGAHFDEMVATMPTIDRG